MGKTHGRSALAFIYMVILLDLIGVNLLFPVQAYIVRQYNSNAITIGYLTVIFSAAQFFAAPILGMISDRAGRRPVLLICLLGSAIGYFIFGLGGAIWVLFLGRLIAGITGGSLSVARAYIADVTPPEKRAQNFALIGAAFGLGMVIGPAISGTLGQVSLSLPLFVAGGLAALNLAFGFFVLPESLPPAGRSVWDRKNRSANPFGAITAVLRVPSLGWLLAAMFVYLFAFNGMTSNIPVFLIEKFNITPSQMSFLYVLIGLVNIAVQGGLIRMIAPRWGEKRLALVGLNVLAAGWLGAVTAPGLGGMYLMAAVTMVGSALVMPSVGALASNLVARNQQGKLAGISASLWGLSNVLGPIWAGAAYDFIAPTAPYWSAAFLLVIASLMIKAIKHTPQITSGEPVAG